MLALKSTEIDREIYKFYFFSSKSDQKSTPDLDQNSILISAVVFREEKLDLDVTLMISAVLSCNHLTCLAQVHKE